VKAIWMLAVLAIAIFGPEWAHAQDDLSVLDALDMDDLVEVEPPPPAWQSIGSPIALGAFFFFVLWLGRLAVPFRVSKESLTLFYFPTGVKRGLALAITLYGIAFAFGAAEIAYQLHLHGSAEAYFANMSQGKLIAFTHAHLFGFTTSFLVIGIPFSMQFNHLWIYQWVFPIGLAAALTDVMSWWGIKYVSPNFEVISIVCGILFSLSYLYMLIGLLRVLLFPQVIWATDKDREERLSKKELDPTSHTGY
tara:strand:- start:525 stop:1274 length:750 start_codon:yes stop_codon:yes gene_type:complete